MPGLSLTSVKVIKLFGISPEWVRRHSSAPHRGWRVAVLKSDGRYTRRIEVA